MPQPNITVSVGLDCKGANKPINTTWTPAPSIAEVATINVTMYKADQHPSVFDSVQKTPKFCVHLFYEGPIEIGSTSKKTINELFITYNVTRVYQSGNTTFSGVDGVTYNTQVSAIADYDEDYTIIVGAVPYAMYPSSTKISQYKMGEYFGLCVGTDHNDFKVDKFLNVTCANPSQTRQLAHWNGATVEFDPLTEKVTDASTAYIEKNGVLTTANLATDAVCLRSIATAGFFADPAVTQFTCTGKVFTKSVRRKLRALQGADDEAANEIVPFEVTYELEQEVVDTLSAGASLVGGAVALVASAVLAMIM